MRCAIVQIRPTSSCRMSEHAQLQLRVCILLADRLRSMSGLVIKRSKHAVWFDVRVAKKKKENKLSQRQQPTEAAVAMQSGAMNMRTS